MPEITGYSQSYYSMTWLGPKGYPEHANAGRCYFTGMLGMLRHWGESDVLFADGTSGDGFSFRWCPVWGAPAFNGGKGAFHEIWEYTPRALGFNGHWEQDPEGAFDEAFEKLRALIDRGIPVQVGLHYSLLLPYGAMSSPRLAFMKASMKESGFGHHVVVAGYDPQKRSVVIWEPNDIAEHARYECPLEVFRRAWQEPSQRANGHYQAWPHHYPWAGEWSLHDGYGPYLMVWVEPGRDPGWDIAVSIRDSFRRNLGILRGDYPRPYALFGSPWQIPHWETGAPGMARCAEAIAKGALGDPLSPTGECRSSSWATSPITACWGAGAPPATCSASPWSSRSATSTARPRGLRRASWAAPRSCSPRCATRTTCARRVSSFRASPRPSSRRSPRWSRPGIRSKGSRAPRAPLQSLPDY